MSHRKAASLFVVSLVAVVIFSYINQLIYRYQVPPGGDAVNHNRIVQAIMGGDYGQIYHYHTAWHLFVIAVSWLFHARTITVMAWLGPLLLVGCSVALYLFNRRQIGFVAGLSSMLLIGFFSLQPIQTLHDGGFPNVLAAGIVMPIFLLTLNQAFSAKRKLFTFGLALILLGLLFYSHHITTIYALVTVFIAGVILIIRKLRDYHVPWLLTTTGVLIIMGLIPFLLRWFLTLKVGLAFDLLAQFVKPIPNYPFINFPLPLDNPNAYWPLQVLPDGIGNAIVYLGIGGFVVALFGLVSKRTPSDVWRTYLILVVWAMVLTIGSQILALGFPVRLARDLAIPLTLLGGVLIQAVYTYVTNRKIPIIFFYLFVVVCLVHGSQAFMIRFKREIAPNNLLSHLPVDTKTAQYITENLPLNAKIGVFYDDIYLPLFAPLHSIRWIDNPRNLIEFEQLDKTLAPYDYLYMERRFDREISSTNNTGLIKRYLESPYVTLEAVFEQPEKKVFLFKINHPLPPS